jgi:hypothetical protein
MSGATANFDVRDVLYGGKTITGKEQVRRSTRHLVCAAMVLNKK